MPLYDYDCAACGRRFEVLHGVHAPGPTTCPLCGKGPVRKAITAAAVHYKGSGWAKKERRATSGVSKSSSDGAGGEETSPPAAAKPDSSTRDGASTADGTSKAEPKPAADAKDSGSASRSSRKPAGADPAKTSD